MSSPPSPCKIWQRHDASVAAAAGDADAVQTSRRRDALDAVIRLSTASVSDVDRRVTFWFHENRILTFGIHLSLQAVDEIETLQIKLFENDIL